MSWRISLVLRVTFVLFCFLLFCFVFRLYAFVEAAALRSIVLRHVCRRPDDHTCFFFLRCRFFRRLFVPFPLSLSMENTSYDLSIRTVFFYLVTWIFYISLCENSINQSVKMIDHGAVFTQVPKVEIQKVFTELTEALYTVESPGIHSRLPWTTSLSLCMAMLKLAPHKQVHRGTHQHVSGIPEDHPNKIRRRQKAPRERKNRYL